MATRRISDILPTLQDQQIYLHARDRGETVRTAMYRVRTERAARETFISHYQCDGYMIDADALLRHTGLVLPEGCIAILTLAYDDYTSIDDYGTVDEGGCYSDEDIAAWRNDEWHFMVPGVEIVDANDSPIGYDSLGGVEMGDYFPGTEGAQVWDVFEDIMREAIRDAEAHLAERQKREVDAAHAEAIHERDARALDAIREAVDGPLEVCGDGIPHYTMWGHIAGILDGTGH